MRIRRNAIVSGLAASVWVLQSLATGGADASTIATPVPLNGNAATDSGDDLSPYTATDSGGNWVAVWQSNENLGGVTGLDNDIFVSRSTNNGSSWSPIAVLNVNAGSDSGADILPRLATDGNGAWVAVWQSTDSLGGTIGIDWDVLVSRSANNGVSWSAPAPLNANAATDSRDDMRPVVISDGQGNWLTVWQSNEDLNGTIGQDFDILVSRSTDNGLTWSAPVPLNTNAASDEGGDTHPQVSTDGVGHWVAVWQSTDTLGGTVGSDSDIFVSRSVNNGIIWSAPAALNSNAATDSGSDLFAQVKTDGTGRWLAVWQSGDSLGGTIGTDDDILVSRSINDGISWTPPVALNTTASADARSDMAPQVSTDASGGWVATWHSTEGSGGSLGSDADILSSRSVNNGVDWSSPIPLNTTAGSDSVDDTEPQIVTDGAGNWITVWTGLVGPDRDILYTDCAPMTDGDCDTISDASDNCPLVANPSQSDGDSDGSGDRCDNCASVSNPSQTNTDLSLSLNGASVTEDGLGDDCDTDDDNDGFADTVETSIGTNKLDNCRGLPGSGGDAWPFDNNLSGAANVIDVLAYKGKIPSAVDAFHPKRLDLDDNNFLNVADVLEYKGILPRLCQ